MPTKIEWTDETWNPVRGCSMAKGSEAGGCLNCYAARLAARNLPEMRSPTTGRPFAILRDSGPRWTGAVELIESKLADPLHWRKPRRVFVNSMSDLFHEALPDEAIDRVFAAMALCPQHTFQVLTKRPYRLLAYLSDAMTPTRIMDAMNVGAAALKWPLPNVWPGVSVENDKTVAERIPLLLKTPASKRFISLEPMLGPVNLRGFLMEGTDPGQCMNCGAGHGFGRCPNYGGIARIRDRRGEVVCADFKRKYFAVHQVIVGGESGPGARPPHPNWVRAIRDQCQAAAVPFFFKQWGEWAPISRTDGIHELPFLDYIPEKKFGFIRRGTKKAGRLLERVSSGAGLEVRRGPRVMRARAVPRTARAAPIELKRAPYQPALSALERNAYAAAHRLLNENIWRRDLAAPGGRRSAEIDAIARIIIQEMKEPL